MSLQMENALPDGFTFEKAQNVMHGLNRGFHLLILPNEAAGQYQIQLYADVEKSGDKEGFLKWLGDVRQSYPFIQNAGYNGSNMVSVSVSSNGAGDKANLTAAVQELTAKCAEYGVHNCCAHCKNDTVLHAASVDNTPLLLCDGCLSQVMSRMGEAKARKENPLFGIIGAVIGVLLGSVLWIVIGQIGFIAGIAGFAIVFCGMKGYGLLGGRLSKFGIFICVMLSFLMILGAEVLSIGITVYQEFGKMYEITLSDAFRVIPELIKEPEVAAGVAKDLVVGYVLAIWASYANIRSAWAQAGEKPSQHTVVRF